MALAGSPKPDSDSESEERNENPNPGDAANPSPAASGPIICVARAAGESVAGAVFGSIFGYGSGLFKRNGFKGSLADAGSSAKTFAALSGIHSLVICLLRRMRGKDDEINAGVAGCCTGLVLSFPGAPQAMLQSCLSFGVFSYMIEKFNSKQPVLAYPLLKNDSRSSSPQAVVLPPFTLPLPRDMVEGFSSFCRSLNKSRRVTHP